MIPRILLGALLALVVAAPLVTPAVAAPDRPVTTPIRDVDVTYRAGQGDKAVIQRSRWSAGGRKMRLDTPTPGVYVIVDYAARTLAMVSDRDHGVLDLPAPPGAMPGQAVPSSTVFTRRGDSKVAGLPCGEWGDDGHPGSGDARLLYRRRRAARGTARRAGHCSSYPRRLWHA